MPPSPYRPPPTTTRRLWKRAAAVAKDKSSICLARACLGPWHRGNSLVRNPELEAAIIKATSHDDSRIDYKNVGRVLSWVKISPSSVGLLMWFLSRRVERTRDWVVALKGLMLAHTVLLCSERVPTKPVASLPFDLSTFRDRSSWGFTTFVRAYFGFLYHRWMFPCPTEEGDEQLVPLSRLWRMQNLLDLLMQIRPYGDGMEQPLLLEAMDCVVIEIFDVYGRFCRGVAQALIDIFGPSSSTCSYPARRRGVRILRRATEQSSRLSAYFDVCRSLGVINASQLPAMETIPEEDIRDLEKLMMEDVDGTDEDKATEEEFGGRVEEEMAYHKDECCSNTTTVVTSEWTAFVDKVTAEKGEGRCEGGAGDDDDRRCGSNNPFLRSSWEAQQLYPHLRHRAVGGEPYSMVGRGQINSRTDGYTLF